MKEFFPGYYRDFQCLAGQCPDSCCKEWAVDVDPQAAQFYRSLPGDLGDALRQVLCDTDGGTAMTIQNGRCPMWRDDGLCRIQAELGHDALCQTCRNFPRLVHDYGTFRELGLELSCPEAARLILSAPAEPLEVRALPGGSQPDYDTELMDILIRCRECTLDFLSRSSYPVPQTLAIVLLYAHSVQGWIDGGDPVDLCPQDCLDDALRYAGAGDLQALADFFKSLEILTPQWEHRLSQLDTVPWTDAFIPLFRYFVQRYWLQTVADFDLVCRVKLAVAACLLIRALGGNFLQTSQLFSKEIENDPDNLETILDACYTSPALTDANLLGLLLKF